MRDEEGYGEEGYTMVGHEHYTVSGEHHLVSHLLAFAVGGIVGAGIALLLAPQTGPRLRQQIKDVSGQTKEKLTSCYDVALDAVGVGLDKGRELIKHGKPILATAFEAGREAYIKERERVAKSS
jgi:gas vesicle protein